MNLMHLFLLLPLGWFVLVAVKPRVHWYVRAWAYRDPEANEPSDTAFSLYRLGAVVMVVLCLVAWVQAFDLSGSDSASPRQERSPSPPAGELEPADADPDTHRLTTAASDQGRISGYSQDGSGFALYVVPGACTGRQVFARVVQEDEETVTVSATISSSDVSCGGELRVLRAQVRSDVTVGERQVVDVDGEPVWPCEENCS
ncbi:hypothetical protein [Nocardiopsis sp. CA-288880]|uniref:hypothetical protein n=1 Tax=Nocardiopsis sp. CA-288880 TaxID=3239995 RepID=UPI003D9684F4